MDHQILSSQTLPEGIPMTSTDLAGTTALVTGATSGIGAAAAVSLAERGAHVLVAGRDTARGDSVVNSIRAAGGKADFVAADLGDGGSVRDLAHRAIELGGGHVDILVNNAGIFPFGPTPDATDDDIDSVYAVNVKAPFVPRWPPGARGPSSTC
jgi:NAD(P)-dependent dehydrogenase (short-subunit alcohol dehydrogenase family)